MAAMYARQGTPQEIVGQLAELAATREVFTLTPATAQQKLGKFAKLEIKKDPESPVLQRLIGSNPDSGILWVAAYFEPSKAASKFREVTFAFAPGDGGADKLYKDFKAVLAPRLANLGEQEQETETYGAIWHIKPRYTVMLQKDDYAINPITEKEQQAVTVHMNVDQD
jgi:hypothetical protein